MTDNETCLMPNWLMMNVLEAQICPSNRSDGVANDVPVNLHQTEVTVEASSERDDGRNFADVITNTS